MEKKKYKLIKGWVAFVKDGKLVEIKEVKIGGSADTILEVINKPTNQEVLDELNARNISLPK